MDCACFHFGLLVPGLAGEHDCQDDMAQAIQADRIEVVIREVELDGVLEALEPALQLVPAESGNESYGAFGIAA